nr:MAG TPA: hypothetical protein [Caudoviricetes sp.]
MQAKTSAFLRVRVLQRNKKQRRKRRQRLSSISQRYIISYPQS